MLRAFSVKKSFIIFVTCLIKIILFFITARPGIIINNIFKNKLIGKLALKYFILLKRRKNKVKSSIKKRVKNKNKPN